MRTAFIVALSLAVSSVAHAQAADTAGAKARADSTARADSIKAVAKARAAYRLDSIVVRAKPSAPVSPVPGLKLELEQMPSNIQSASGEDIKDSHAVSITEFMNSWMQSVNVNDYSGNPFQQAVNFRGFSASPEIGTPQGLSVFLDGVRVNEAFGDVVNWDLLPLNAISTFNVFPGSNPLFGLNTLGGALSLRTKDGFSDPGVEVSALGADWGRKQFQGSAGGSIGKLGGFAALNYFDENGWRDNSPSTLEQGFGRLDYHATKTTITATALLAHNDLVGNGLIPYEMFQQRPENVFSSPDETKNKLSAFTGTGQFFVTAKFNITAQLYTRRSDRDAVTGDVDTDDFENFNDDRDTQRYTYGPHSLPYCEYVDADHNGLPDGDGQPLNAPCDQIQIGSGIPRNGADGTDFIPPEERGIIAGTPIGVMSATSLGQRTSGGVAQFNFNLEKHKFLVATSYDDASSTYSFTQQLASIDASRRVFLDPTGIDEYYRAAQVPILVNAFAGTAKTWSAYASETWSPSAKWDVTAALRYNRATVHNALDTRSLAGRSGGDLTAITNRNVRFPRILCPTSDPATCPDSAFAVLAVLDTAATTRTTGTVEDYTFPSFNPSFGVSYRPTPWLNLYGNISRGARPPSVVELGCAFDGTPVNINAGIIGNDGHEIPPLFEARSLTGPTCTLPGALSGDPFLKQVRSTSSEVGARGTFRKDWSWNTALYRTDLQNDIMFVGASPQRSFFQTAGNTRRQGFELGANGVIGRLGVRGSYSYVDATYRSKIYMLSPDNSSSDFDPNSQPISGRPTETANANGTIGTYLMEEILPGDHLPGISRHNLNLRGDYRILRAWSVGLNMTAHSRSYLLGNENNLHTTGGTDAQAPLYIREDDGVVRAETQQTPGRPFDFGGDVPGFAVFGVTSDVRITKRFTATLVIENLFDRTYFTAGRLGITPFSPSVNGDIGPSGWNYNSNEWTQTTFVGPGAPRFFSVTLSYRFGGKQGEH